MTATSLVAEGMSHRCAACGRTYKPARVGHRLCGRCWCDDRKWKSRITPRRLRRQKRAALADAADPMLVYASSPDGGHG